MSVSEFPLAYVVLCVSELLDRYHAIGRVDAERLALSEAPWLADCAV